MKSKLYLLLQVIDTGKQFFKYFDCEWEMDKLDSRDIYYALVD